MVEYWLQDGTPGVGSDGEVARIVGTTLRPGERGDLGYGVQLVVGTESGLLDGALEDVILNAYEHRSAAMARTTAGNLRLTATREGLDYEALVSPGDTAFADLYLRVKSGVMDGVSAGFVVAKDGVDFELNEETGVIVQTVNDIDHVFELTVTERPVLKRSTAVGLIGPGGQDLSGRDPRAGVPKSLLRDQERALARRSAKPDWRAARHRAKLAEARSGG